MVSIRVRETFTHHHPSNFFIMKASTLLIFVFSFVTFFLSSNFLQSQISLTEKTNSADLVIESTVISKSVKQTKDKKLIYTENLVEISKLFKGSWSKKTITLITLGGITKAGNSQYFSHYAELGENQSGIFFCSLSPYQEFKNRDFGDARLLFEENGVITYATKFSEVKAYDNFQNYESIQALYNKLMAATRVSVIDSSDFMTNNNFVRKPCDRSVPQTIYLSFHNFEYISTLNGQFLEFDIMAKASENGIYFGKAELFIKYSPQPFGYSIVQNQKIEVTKDQIIQDSTYSLILSDESSNDVKISIQSGAYQQFDYYPMTVLNEKLCHVKIEIEDLSALADISFDDFKIDGNVFYYCDRSLVPFDNIHISNTVAISPAPADAESITYTFENAFLISDQTGFVVDVFAASDMPTSFAGATFFVKYNSEVFGTNASDNVSINFPNSFGIYSIEKENFSEDILKIEFAAIEPVSQSELVELNNLPNKLFTLSFSGIIDCAASAGLGFEVTMMQGLSYHYTGDVPIPNELYDPVIVDNDIDDVLCGCDDGDPQVLGLDNTLLHAGAREVLTITGSHFGFFDVEKSRVIFRNADSASTLGTVGQAVAEVGEIISWQDDEIKIYVPSVTNSKQFTNPAGTGKVKVMNACGIGESSETLHIPYSLWNNRQFNDIPSLPIVLSNLNENGIKFTFSTNISNNNLLYIKSAFIEALEEWCIQTQVAFFIDDNDSSLTQTNPDDNVNLVVIQELNATHGKAGVIVSADYVNLCIDSDEEEPRIGYRMVDMDIRVSPSITESSVSYGDIKNYFLHELGHCHMLQHAINPNSNPITDPTTQYAMYPDGTNINANNADLTIKQADENGAETIFPRSTSVLNNSNCNNLTPIATSENCGDTNAVRKAENLKNINIIPNPNNGYFNIDLSNINLESGEIRIIDILGTEVFRTGFAGEIINIKTNLPKGNYIVLVHNDISIYSHKLLIL